MKGIGVIFAAISLFALVGCDRGSHPRMIGAPAPDFTVQDKDRSVSLHDFHGRTVVLNFWNSWCGPCLEEMPSLIRMQRQMDKNKVVVLAVDIRDSEKGYRQYITENHVDLLTVRDEWDKSADLYGTTGQPETFIIDPSGILRRKLVGPINWTSPDMIEYLKSL